MNFFEVVSSRHSYRGRYLDQPVPRQDLLKIVDAGVKAPSGKNAQTTRFVIVDDPGILEEIIKLYPSSKAVQSAKALIFAIVDKEPEKILEKFDFQVEDCAAAVENMLLAVTAMGYASVWIDGWLRLENRAEIIGELLQLPPEKQLRIMLPIGVPAEDVIQERPKMPLEERAWFNSYGKSF